MGQVADILRQAVGAEDRLHGIEIGPGALQPPREEFAHAVLQMNVFRCLGKTARIITEAPEAVDLALAQGQLEGIARYGDAVEPLEGGADFLAGGIDLAEAGASRPCALSEVDHIINNIHVVDIMDDHLVPAVFAENLDPEINPVLKLRRNRKSLIRENPLQTPQKQ